MRQDYSLRLAFPFLCGGFSFVLLSLGSFYAAPFLIFSYLAPLPLFLLGFLFSYEEVLIGALVASFLHVFFADGGAGHLVGYAVFYVLPPVGFSYIVKRYHEVMDWGKGPLEKPFEAFAGQYFLVIALGFVLLLQFYFSMPLSENRLEHLFAQLSPFFAGEDCVVQEKVLPWFQDYFSGIVGFSWMLMVFLNLVLAQSLAKRLDRPMVVTLSLQHWKVFGWQYWFLASMLMGVIFAPVSFQNCFKSLAFLSLFPFLLEGISILDGVCGVLFKQAPWKTIMLYGLLVFLGWPLVALVCLGLFEPWVHVRRRLGNPS